MSDDSSDDELDEAVSCGHEQTVGGRTQIEEKVDEGTLARDLALSDSSDDDEMETHEHSDAVEETDVAAVTAVDELRPDDYLCKAALLHSCLARTRLRELGVHVVAVLAAHNVSCAGPPNP